MLRTLAQQPDVSSSGCALSTVPVGTITRAAHPWLLRCLRVAALLASSRPETRSYELATLLRQQADPLPCPGYDETGRADLDTNCATGNGFYGHGLVNALTAVNAQLGSVPDRTDR